MTDKMNLYCALELLLNWQEDVEKGVIVSYKHKVY